jgi:CubicO group peptidase (beta-lactamase class C family)
VTKLFTDLLLADMVAHGEVKLDDPVRDYLPQGTLADHGYRPITLRDLASHYSGMPRYPRHMDDAERSDPFAGYDEAHLYAFLSGWTPMRSPGAMFEYSNLGAAVLGDALARRAGKPYEELLTERVLSPLGLQHTNFTDEGLAVPHDAKGNAVNPWHLGTLNPAGGLRSTVGDMARFSAALLDPPAKLRRAVDLMMDQKLRPAGGFSEVGLGLLTVPTTAGVLLSHDGGTGGMRSSLYLDRKRKRAVVVLTNTAGDPDARELGVSLIAGAAPPASAEGQP